MTTFDSESSPQEIGLNQPTAFDGNRKNTEIFIQNCYIYLTINDAVYDIDVKKIAFVLSHMTEKMQLWKRLFMKTHINVETGDINFPTYLDFIGKLEKDFEAEEHDEEALNKLYLLKQGNRTAEELVSEFRSLAREGGLEFQTYSDHIHMIRLFQNALKPQLVREIILSQEVPKKIVGWFNKAIQFDRVLAITGKGPRRQETKTRNRSWNFPKPTEKNPTTHASDFDAMSQQERTDLMKRGACFRCRKPGHRARDCPSQAEENTSMKKWTPKDIHAIIRAMTEEEQAELLTLQIDEGTY